MELWEFESMVRRVCPTEITDEVVAAVFVAKGASPFGSAASPRRADLPGYTSGTLADTFDARFEVGDLVYTKDKPSSRRWMLET